MAEVLKISEDNHGFYIAWYCDGEEGTQVGNSPGGKPPANADERDAFEIATTERIAAEDPTAVLRSFVYHWESRSAATKALRAMKLALKQDRPMPEWAKTALAEGWKPPKGWKA